MKGDVGHVSTYQRLERDGTDPCSLQASPSFFSRSPKAQALGAPSGSGGKLSRAKSGFRIMAHKVFQDPSHDHRADTGSFSPPDVVGTFASS